MFLRTLQKRTGYTGNSKQVATMARNNVPRSVPVRCDIHRRGICLLAVLSPRHAGLKSQFYPLYRQSYEPASIFFYCPRRLQNRIYLIFIMSNSISDWTYTILSLSLWMFTGFIVKTILKMKCNFKSILFSFLHFIVVS